MMMKNGKFLGKKNSTKVVIGTLGMLFWPACWKFLQQKQKHIDSMSEDEKKSSQRLFPQNVPLDL